MGFKDRDLSTEELGDDIAFHSRGKTHPDGGWGWVIVASAFVIQFIVIGLVNSSGVFFAALVDHYKRSKGETAWVGSLGVGIMFLCGPLATSLCEKYNCRLVALTGSSLCVFGLFISSYASNLETLYVTYGLTWGFGASLCYFPTLIALMPYFNKRLALVNGIVTSGSGFGTFAISPLAQFMVDKTGVINCLRILATAHLLCIPCALTFRPVNENYQQAQMREHHIANGDIKKHSGHYKIRSIWKEPAFLIFVIAVWISMLGYFVPFVHLVRQATMLGIPTSKSSLLVSYMSAASIIGKLVAGKIADFPFFNRRVIYQFAMLAMSIALTLIPISTSYISLVCVVLLFGFFEAAYIMMIPLVTRDIVGLQRTPRAIGTLFMVLSFPAMMGPPLAGWLYDASSSYETAFFVAGFVITLGVILMFLIPFIQNANERSINSTSHQLMIGSIVSMAIPTSGETLSSGKITAFYEPSTSSSNATSCESYTIKTDVNLERESCV